MATNKELIAAYPIAAPRASRLCGAVRRSSHGLVRGRAVSYWNLV